MLRKKIYPWPEIKADYLSYVGLVEISTKYNVPINTLKSRIRRGHWKKEREMIEEEVVQGRIIARIEDEKKIYQKLHKEWYATSVKIYQELVDKVKQCNDLDGLNLLLAQFMSFCKMNELVLNPEHPDHMKIISN
jgi:uncharacterized protein YjcR